MNRDKGTTPSPDELMKEERRNERKNERKNERSDKLTRKEEEDINCSPRGRRERNTNEKSTDGVKDHRFSNQIQVLTFKLYSLTNGAMLRTKVNWTC